MAEIASVQVIGAGLIGTSIALGLRERGVEVHLDDANPEHLRVAAGRGAGVAGHAEEPDLVIVAVPPYLNPGDEIYLTQSAVDLIQLVGKYMFSGGGGKPADNAAQNAGQEADVPDYLKGDAAPTDETKTP